MAGKMGGNVETPKQNKTKQRMLSVGGRQTAAGDAGSASGKSKTTANL